VFALQTIIKVLKTYDKKGGQVHLDIVWKSGDSNEEVIGKTLENEKR
jgi:hypothetical protein